MSEQNEYQKLQLNGPEGVIVRGAEALAQSTSVGQLFETANRMAVAFMDMHFAIPEIRDAYERFTNPEEKGHTTIERIRKAVHEQNFEGVQVESDEYGTLLQATFLREKIARDLILATIAIEDNNLNLNPTVKAWLTKGIPMLEKFDQMQYKLWQYVVQDKQNQGPEGKPGIFAHFRDLQQRYEERYRLEHPDPKDKPDPQYAFKTYFAPLIPGHGDFLFTLPGFNSEREIIAIPYAEFFREELEGDTGLIKMMAELIEELEEPAHHDEYAKLLIAGYVKLAQLLTCKDSAQLERIAQEQDRLFIQAGKIQPPDDPTVIPLLMFPPMEAYLGDWKMHVNLEHWMGFVDTRHQEYNQDLQEAQEALLEIFASVSDDEVVRKSTPGMQLCKAIFYDLLRSGTTYKSYASNIPNRLAIRLANGNIIDLDFSTFIEKSRQTNNNLRQGFDEQTMYRWFLDENGETDPDLLRKQAVGVGLHEVGHSALIAPDTMDRLTPPVYSNLEELKSDLCGLVGGLHFYRNSPEDLQKFVAALLALHVRGLTRWQDFDDRTHFHGDVTVVKMMIDAGILHQGDNGKWIFDPSTDPDNNKISQLQELAMNLLRRFATVYQHREVAEGQDLLESIYKDEESDDVISFAKAVGINTSPPSRGDSEAA